MPWPTPGDVPFGRQSERRQALRCLKHRLYRDQIVAVAVHEQNRRSRFDLGRKRFDLALRRCHQESGITDNAAGAVARRRPTCSAIIVPWLKPTSAVPTAAICGG